MVKTLLNRLGNYASILGASAVLSLGGCADNLKRDSSNKVIIAQNQEDPINSQLVRIYSNFLSSGTKPSWEKVLPNGKTNLTYALEIPQTNLKDRTLAELCPEISGIKDAFHFEYFMKESNDVVRVMIFPAYPQYNASRRTHVLLNSILVDIDKQTEEIVFKHGLKLLGKIQDSQAKKEKIEVIDYEKFIAESYTYGIIRKEEEMKKKAEKIIDEYFKKYN